MASFCAKCGAEVSSDKQVCPSCGAAASAQPTAVQPTAAPAKSGGSAVKIILIIVAIVVGLGLLGIGGRRIHGLAHFAGRAYERATAQR